MEYPFAYQTRPKSFSLILFVVGQLCLSILVCLVFMTFLFYFLLLAKRFSCILSMYLGYALRLLMIFRLLTIKTLRRKNRNVFFVFLIVMLQRNKRVLNQHHHPPPCSYRGRKRHLSYSSLAW
jgi:hypothetical protein